MSSNVCSQCGAPVTSDSKFCSHCGAKIQDDVIRKHIQIDNTAEIKRAEYETQESQVRQKQMKSGLTDKKLAWILIGILFALSLFAFVTGLVQVENRFLTIFIGISGFFLCGYLSIKNLFRK